MPVPSDEIERHAARWARDPKSRAFAQLADAYRKEGFLDEAIEICLQGLKDHPTYVSARVVLGRAYLEKGELDRAEAEFLKVIELDPENLPAHRLLGEIYLQQGRQAEARNCYDEVLRLNPFDREVKELLQTLPLAPMTPSLTEPEPGSSEVHPPSLPLEGPKEPVTVEAPPDLPTVGLPLPEEESAGAILEEPMGPQDPLEVIPLSETLADLYVQQGLLDEAAVLYRKLLEEDPSKEHLKRKLETLGELRRLHDDLSPDRGLPAPRPEQAPPGSEQRLLVIFEEWLEELRRLKALRQRN